MALKMCLKFDKKFDKFEHNFAGLGKEMAELHKEYVKLRVEIAQKENEFCGQIALLENELKKLREENGILTCRLMNNAAEEREKQQV
jgi:hypothetical protein